jgi:hypothetical protein
MKADHDLIRFDIPFRVRLGVTGHRKLQDPDSLSNRINQFMQEEIFDLILDLFDENSRNAVFSSSSHTPICLTILTPLAEGADQIVAREVLKTQDARIEVVLPMLKEDYLETFEFEEGKQRFEELFAEARRPVTLREQRLRDESPESDLGAARKKAYEDVGRYVVDHCDILIAVWNGEPAQGQGGTAEIVSYAEKKKRTVIVIHPAPPHDISILKGTGLNAKSIEQIELFNTFPMTATDQDNYVQNMYKRLFDNLQGHALPGDLKELVREKLLPCYVRASSMAKHNQGFYRFTGSFVYVVSTAALAAVAYGTLFPEWKNLAFLVEAVLLTSIFALVKLADRRRSHRKWIESRFLAERIRSAVFLTVCNVEVSPVDVPPYMLTAHKPHDWMIRIFDEVWNRLPRMTGCKGELCQSLVEFIRVNWIQDQIEFHRDKATKVGIMSRIFERAGMTVFFIALAVAVAHLAVSWLGHDFHSVELEKTMTLLAIVLPAVGAAIGGVRSHREYSRVEKRSENMEHILSELDESFSHVRTPEHLAKLLWETEELMLRETQDWLMLMRFVELKPAA